MFAIDIYFPNRKVVATPQKSITLLSTEELPTPKKRRWSYHQSIIFQGWAVQLPGRPTPTCRIFQNVISVVHHHGDRKSPKDGVNLVINELERP